MLPTLPHRPSTPRPRDFVNQCPPGVRNAEWSIAQKSEDGEGVVKGAFTEHTEGTWLPERPTLEEMALEVTPPAPLLHPPVACC